MEKLYAELTEYIAKSNSKDLSDAILDGLYYVYPFNKFEYIISHLLGKDIISLDAYYDIRDSYLKRNKYLYLFEISAPRAFGETWAQNHLNEFVPELDVPSKKTDPKFSGEYDFWYEGLKVEVKASRAVDANSDAPLYMKALNSKSKKTFNMNFQQIKPSCCDIFVWIGVWRDTIKYWILSSEEVRKNDYFSTGQHRLSVGEGQLWITNKNISCFKKYETMPRNILKKLKRQKKQNQNSSQKK